MLDIKYIRENLEKVRKAAGDKNRKVDFDRLLSLDDERRKLITDVEKLRAERNELAKSDEREAVRERGRKLKEEIRKLEDKLKIVGEEFKNLMYTVPNVPDESVPVGPNADFNKEVKKWGEGRKFDFKPLDHITLAKKLDLVDFDRGTKIAGFRGYFLKNEAALIEMGILAHTFKKLVKKGYIPLMAPSLVKEFTLFGNGQFPWGREEVYMMEKDELYLAGTAEVPVTAYFSGEVLSEKELPKKFVAFSPCFRREAGSYGKDTKGLYRLHQFNKVEQVIINKNDYQGSLELHEELLRNSEEVLQDLKLPYRVMLMCTGDMGEPQVKKYDVETWMPSRNGYGETMSNSFMGDFQTRRLNIRYKTKDGKTEYTHSLNNTAVASPRILIAILENYQQKDGSVKVPEILREFVGKEVIVP
ncbi:serine--tRNA ligase [Candidatus Gottesmanbacteria bacterium RIFCSPLOWO2_02_FULL_38_8]|uniref:Serine--tRNA ligase n=1 Tax=Candidatus Gottesmanbacteria bacterium RIFCSPLOWO2_02_FULL_38_8 TaxID=1798397 RepID=A0A1F6B6Z2_9BACT|nr:MAG: serine--tRNA ligase [Candidatus Gottesmanbacteria bacterium RIFCSPLOWO2_02_FULL_38_8]